VLEICRSGFEPQGRDPQRAEAPKREKTRIVRRDRPEKGCAGFDGSLDVTESFLAEAMDDVLFSQAADQLRGLLSPLQFLWLEATRRDVAALGASTDHAMSPLSDDAPWRIEPCTPFADLHPLCQYTCH